MTMRKINPVLRDLWIAWLRDAEGELMKEEPNVGLLLKHIQLLIDALTPFPVITEVIEALEQQKEAK